MAQLKADPVARGSWLRPSVRRLGLFAGVVAGLVGLSQACGEPLPADYPERPAGPPGVPTPLTSATRQQTSVASASARVELREFQPLLALNELGAVAAHVRTGHPGEAAETLTQLRASGQLGELTKTAVGQARLSFLLGRLLVQAGSHPQAAAAFHESSQTTWPLTEYAAFEEGTAWLSAGFAERALDAFSRVQQSSVLEARLAQHRAEAYELLGRFGQALQQYDAFLDRDPPPSGWQAVTLHIGEGLAQRVGKPDEVSSEQVVQGIRYLRRLTLSTPDSDLGSTAKKLQQQLVAGLGEQARVDALVFTPSEQLAMLESKSDAGQHSDVRLLAQDLLKQLNPVDPGPVGCEARVLLGKALAGLKRWGEGSESLTETARICKDPDLRAKALFLAGRYAFADKRYSVAARLFEQLEREHPGHRLADDARIYRARCHQELGDTATRARLLTDIVEDYPEGDVALDGAFQLALDQIERGDWNAAITILSRAVSHTKVPDSSRSVVEAGRERYFLARGWEATGEADRAAEMYASLIRELPLTYYMLSAYSRLVARAPEQAQKAVSQAMQTAREEPFVINVDSEIARVEFQRALELLRQGELDWAHQELEALGISEQGVAPQLLWSAALLFDAGGATEVAHELARQHAIDWAKRWPAGDWLTVWRLAFPTPHWQAIRRAALANDVEPSLVYAVIREESAFNAGAVSQANAHGLMQLIPSTAKHFGERAGLPHEVPNLYQPEVNIQLGCSVLAAYRKYFPDNPLLGVPGYNAGPGRPKRWLREYNVGDFDVWVELIPFRETRRYTKRVLASRATYGFLYGDDLDQKISEEAPGPTPLRREALELPLSIVREQVAAR